MFRLKGKLILAFIAIIIIAVVLNILNHRTDEKPANIPELILSTTESETQAQTAAPSDISSKENTETYIILSDDMTTINGDGASFENSRITITKGGTYTIKGVLTDGSIYVNTTDKENKVRLLLSGVSISCATDAPIYIENSPKETVITLEDGTLNFLSDSPEKDKSQNPADYATAVVYSKDDLRIDGEGTLNIIANFNKGIFSKGDIDISSANLNIVSADDGIRSKDSIKIESGNIAIACEGDGIRTSDETADVKGKLIVYDGNITVDSECDGIESAGDLLIAGGKIEITTAGGSTGDHSGHTGDILSSDNMTGKDKDDLLTSKSYPEESSALEAALEGGASAIGLKAKGEIDLSDAAVKISARNDAIYGKSVQIESGYFSLESDDDGIHGDEEVEIDGGNIDITDSYQGIEGSEIELSGGTVIIKAYNDGLNSVSPVPGNMHYNEECHIEVDGAYVHIDSDGNGIDSKAQVLVSDGTLIVFGSEDDAVSVGSYRITSGTMLILGNSLTAKNVIGDGVPVIACSHSQTKNVVMAITDSENNSVIGFCSPKRYESIVFASDKLQKDEYYSLYQGGSFDSDALNGIYDSGTYSGGFLVRKLSKPWINLDKTQ